MAGPLHPPPPLGPAMKGRYQAGGGGGQNDWISRKAFAQLGIKAEN